MADDLDECACGHIYDEHYPPDDAEMANACSVDGCDCFHYEEG